MTLPNYAGDPNAFPIDYAIPDDGDSENGTSVDVALEALGDRTAYLKARAGQMQALTFLAPVPTTIDLPVVKYCEALHSWMAIGSGAGGADYFVSTSQILTWPSATEITTTNGNGEWDFDVDPSGNVVVIDEGADNVKERTAAGVWHLRGTDGDATFKPNVLFEPVSGNWIMAFQTGGGAIKVRTSSDRFVTYTTRAAPAFPAAAEVTMGTDGAGRVVMWGWLTTNVYFSYSDDGGVTWSAPSTHALGFTYAISAARQNPKPIHTRHGWLAVGANGTLHVSRVFTSIDGVTWTVASSQASTGILSIANLEDTVMGVTTRGETVHSVDAGVTWRAGEGKYLVSAVTPLGVVATKTRFVLIAHDTIYPGLGVGVGGGLVT